MQFSHNAITISKTQIRCAYFHLQCITYNSIRSKEVKRLTVCITMSCRNPRKRKSIYYISSIKMTVDQWTFSASVVSGEHQVIHSWVDPLTSEQIFSALAATANHFSIKHWNSLVCRLFMCHSSYCFFFVFFVMVNAQHYRIYTE